ncbi:type IV pilus assembly protein PilQ [Pseudidiomarina indica]|uniref:Type IV pilus assembly protein PilQ n=2 Tax=Pseudidiomarina indica TaxID=1159017 RepID=A0A1G6D4V2_9GAMM|nr:type IV pilus assembly protein PilQ [Pseudidiomarina indica]
MKTLVCNLCLMLLFMTTSHAALLPTNRLLQYHLAPSPDHIVRVQAHFAHPIRFHIHPGQQASVLHEFLLPSTEALPVPSSTLPSHPLLAHIEWQQQHSGTLLRVQTTRATQAHFQRYGELLQMEFSADETSPPPPEETPLPTLAESLVSFNFQTIPVRELLQLLADERQLNLVASDSVQGHISLRLDDVPWDLALNTILQVQGLAKRLDHNILVIAPAAEMAQLEADELARQHHKLELSPLVSDYIQINYAKAEELAQILRTERSDMLSSRGTVAIDQRTNTLLIRDTPHHLAAAKELVAVLDIPIKQVIIEAHMVTVRDNISDELGIQWGLSDANGDSTRRVSGDFTLNLPVATPAATLGLQVARFIDDRLLSLELSALERENKGEIIANPRITTANQKQAYIEQGTEIPYVESGSLGATSVQFKKAVLGLTVTPQITPDNRIILDLVITQNTRGETVTTPTGPAVSIDTQEINTQVLVENGETIVLGGIYQQQILNDIAKVPGLGDIPYVGVLFRNDVKVAEKRELLIFVTPRIVSNDP